MFSRALTASLLLLAGCQRDSGVKPATPDAGQAVKAPDPDPLAIDCVKGVPQPGRVTIFPTPDFIEIRSISYPLGGADARLVGNREAAVGQACQKATNKDLCLSALDRLAVTRGFNEQCEEDCDAYFLAATRGDTVAAVTTVEMLGSLLGTIDTAQEAALMVFAAGYNPCSRGTQVEPRGAPPVVTARPEGFDGFEVIGYTGHGSVRHTVRVSTAGEVAVVKREVDEKGSP
ncbi:hypothetical protein D7W81_01380 [Corallococcus aberystwythensis]|uniref:Lipoprotein n=1 Tax=Corallococcus aberystwythensis TaxID=2316722 RepID=A0A3A8RG52_9BACT|nr:hypothetical protein D7W81_01380 [Corallococcus aberystwythensis]